MDNFKATCLCCHHASMWSVMWQEETLSRFEHRLPFYITIIRRFTSVPSTAN